MLERAQAEVTKAGQPAPEGFGEPTACATCHAVPADLSHVNGVALVTFGAPARLDADSPWSRAK